MMNGIKGYDNPTFCDSFSYVFSRKFFILCYLCYLPGDDSLLCVLDLGHVKIQLIIAGI